MKEKNTKQKLTTEKFVKLSRNVLRNPGISRNAKTLYALLLDYAWDDGECFPSQETLATDLGISKRTLKRDLDELRELGLITWEQRGYKKSNLYSILLNTDLSTRVDKYDNSSGENEKDDLPDMSSQKVELTDMTPKNQGDKTNMSTSDLPNMATNDMTNMSTILDSSYYTQNTDTQSFSLRRKRKNDNDEITPEKKHEREQKLKSQLKEICETEAKQPEKPKPKTQKAGEINLDSLDPLVKQIVTKLDDLKSVRYYQKIAGLVNSGEIPRALVLSAFFETLGDFKRNPGINRGAIFTTKLNNKLANRVDSAGRSKINELAANFLDNHSI